MKLKEPYKGMSQNPVRRKVVEVVVDINDKTCLSVNL
jgi:hypothetical protein